MAPDILTRSLLPGERIVWSGQPGRGLVLTSRDIFLIPFSLLWCGFAVLWTIAATNAGAPVLFTLWGAGFVCIGLIFAVGRFAADAWLRGRMCYAVTDRRVLIVRASPFGSLIALNLDQLADSQLNERSTGRGTIRFGQSRSLMGYQGISLWVPALDSVPQFINIDDARRVFDLIQRARQ